MKRLIVFIALSCMAVCAMAQDRIYFNDDRVVTAFVEEVTDDYVYYRMHDPVMGPSYSARMDEVEQIVYMDGRVSRYGFAEEDAIIARLGGTPGMMHYFKGKLYVGRQSEWGARKADYIALNLYGERYLKARRQRKGGIALLTIGSLFMVEGIIAALDGAPEGWTYGGFVLGAAGLGSGIPLYCKGKKTLKTIASDYNGRLQGNQSALTFGPCRSGVGFALNF